MRKKFNKEISDMSVLVIGIPLCVILAVGLAMLAAILIVNGTVDESSIVVIGMFIIGLSSFFGVLLSHHIAGCMKFYTCILTAAGYLVCLSSIGAVCYRAQMQGFWATALLIFGCSLLAKLCMKERGRSGSRFRRKYANLTRR